eukprot:TRINITY_DN9096_c0_g1_i1.p1 TRINITY_DN9096_c0_g1~~TRINITY_DN9096_c0_g1_i1.p1  ORF type:complete len:446 (+),score=60.02 TRINITY_DN9096_c0_g1_i1:23-1339(+)
MFALWTSVLFRVLASISLCDIALCVAHLLTDYTTFEKTVEAADADLRRAVAERDSFGALFALAAMDSALLRISNVLPNESFHAVSPCVDYRVRIVRLASVETPAIQLHDLGLELPLSDALRGAVPNRMAPFAVLAKRVAVDARCDPVPLVSKVTGQHHGLWTYDFAQHGQIFEVRNLPAQSPARVLVQKPLRAGAACLALPAELLPGSPASTGHCATSHFSSFVVLAAPVKVEDSLWLWIIVAIAGVCYLTCCLVALGLCVRTLRASRFRRRPYVDLEVSNERAKESFVQRRNTTVPDTLQEELGAHPPPPSVVSPSLLQPADELGEDDDNDNDDEDVPLVTIESSGNGGFVARAQVPDTDDGGRSQMGRGDSSARGVKAAMHGAPVMLLASKTATYGGTTPQGSDAALADDDTATSTLSDPFLDCDKVKRLLETDGE